jgi:hypothetical protein
MPWTEDEDRRFNDLFLPLDFNPMAMSPYRDSAMEYRNDGTAKQNQAK